MTPHEYDQEINIISQQIIIARTSDERERLEIKLRKKRLEKEIAEIRLKIQQLSLLINYK
jgi:hypothetical protein